jgi:hypothetical protein
MWHAVTKPPLASDLAEYGKTVRSGMGVALWRLLLQRPNNLVAYFPRKPCTLLAGRDLDLEGALPTWVLLDIM